LLYEEKTANSFEINGKLKHVNVKDILQITRRNTE